MKAPWEPLPVPQQCWQSQGCAVWTLKKSTFSFCEQLLYLLRAVLWCFSCSLKCCFSDINRKGKENYVCTLHCIDFHYVPQQMYWVFIIQWINWLSVMYWSFTLFGIICSVYTLTLCACLLKHKNNDGLMHRARDQKGWGWDPIVQCMWKSLSNHVTSIKHNKSGIQNWKQPL